MHICIYIHTYVQISMHICMYIHIYVHVATYMYYMRHILTDVVFLKCSKIHICIFIDTYIYICIYLYMYVYIYIYVSICTYMYIYVHVATYMYHVKHISTDSNFQSIEYILNLMTSDFFSIFKKYTANLIPCTHMYESRHICKSRDTFFWICHVCVHSESLNLKTSDFLFHIILWGGGYD